MAGLIGAAVGVASLAAAEAGAKDPRIAHYQRIELRGALLRQHESTHGFIFFYILPDKQLPDTAELVVRLNDAVDESSFSVRLPFSGLICKPDRRAARRMKATGGNREGPLCPESQTNGSS
jgi:hypothetical protein